MSTLAQAYVQIVPTTKGISGALSNALGGEASSAGASAGETLGSKLVSVAKTVIVGGAIGAAVKSSLDAGGALQQSFGGLDTLYGDASASMKDFAYEAASAGISANTFAEQATSFGAALKQAYGGDMTKAANAANTAILDMADNSAKMGTDISSIQTAYQGFAKANYTMLDNLKLGYGGTKSEMQRLLADAETLTGKKYDISNFGDITEAIHVMQGELGLTGVAAAEAEGTFTGSMGAMKAAAENLMANLALGEDFTDSLNSLTGNAIAFINNNMIPMIVNVFRGLPKALTGLSNLITTELFNVSEAMPTIVSTATEIISDFAVAIVGAVPYLLQAGGSLISSFVTEMINFDWTGAAQDLLTELSDTLGGAASSIMPEGASATLEQFLNGITANLPSLLSGGVNILTSIATGILQALPNLITTAGGLVNQFVGFIAQNLPTLINSGMQLLNNIISGIAINLPLIASAALNVISSLASTLMMNAPAILNSLSSGIINNISLLVSAAWTLASQFAAFIAQNLPTFLMTGAQMLNNVINGFLTMLPGIISAAGSVINSILNYILSNLPSMLSAGVQLLSTLGRGILNHIPGIIATIAQVLAKILATIAKHLPQILQAGITLLGKLAAGIIRAIPQLVGQLPRVFSSIKNAFGNFDWLQLGKDLIAGIGKGITAGAGLIVGAAKDALSSAVSAGKHLLGIASPSKVMRDQVGKWIPAGIAEGIDRNAGAVEDAMADIGYGLNGTYNAGVLATAQGGVIGNQNAATSQQNVLLQQILDAIKEGKIVTIDGETTIGWIDNGLGALA